MRLQGTQYFQRLVQIPVGTMGDIAEYDISAVPLFIGALETRKARSFYATEGDWLRGTLAINRLQRSLLMGAVRDLVIEIRGTRGREGEVFGEVDPDIVPIGLYSGVQMKDILSKLGSDPLITIEGQLTDVNMKLQALVDAAQTPDDKAALLGVLQNILLALG